MPESDLRSALAIPDTTPLWVAVLHICNEIEGESLINARGHAIGNDRLTNNALGMADGAAEVRKRLIERRAEALKEFSIRNQQSAE